MNLLATREAAHAELLRILPGLIRRLITAMPHEVPGLARVTPEQFDLLSHLVKSGTLTMTELASRRSVALNTTTTLVDRLVVAGLVERQSDPADRRLVRAATTEKGRLLVAGLREARRQVVQEMLERLSDEDIKHIQGALPALARLAGLPEEALSQ